MRGRHVGDEVDVVEFGRTRVPHRIDHAPGQRSPNAVAGEETWVVGEVLEIGRAADTPPALEAHGAGEVELRVVRLSAVQEPVVVEVEPVHGGREIEGERFDRRSAGPECAEAVGERQIRDVGAPHEAPGRDEVRVKAVEVVMKPVTPPRPVQRRLPQGAGPDHARGSGERLDALDLKGVELREIQAKVCARQVVVVAPFELAGVYEAGRRLPSNVPPKPDHVVDRVLEP